MDEKVNHFRYIADVKCKIVLGMVFGAILLLAKSTREITTVT